MSAKEKSKIWWGGALKGALKALPIGLGIGLAAAALLAFVAIPLFPELGSVMGGFLTYPDAPSLLSIPYTQPAAPFFPLPLLVFNTAITVAANVFSSGDLAVAQHQQTLDHAENERRIGKLEEKQRTLTQQVGEPPMQSTAPLMAPAIVDILAQGPASSHTQQQDARAQLTALQTSSIH